MENVAYVLSQMRRKWYEDSPGYGSSLSEHLDVPDSEEEKIKLQKQIQPLTSLAAYLVHHLPGVSWAVLAGALYYCNEEKALQEAMKYIKDDSEGDLYRIL